MVRSFCFNQANLPMSEETKLKVAIANDRGVFQWNGPSGMMILTISLARALIEAKDNCMFSLVTRSFQHDSLRRSASQTNGQFLLGYRRNQLHTANDSCFPSAVWMLRLISGIPSFNRLSQNIEPGLAAAGVRGPLYVRRTHSFQGKQNFRLTWDKRSLDQQSMRTLRCKSFVGRGMLVSVSVTWASTWA